MAAARSADTAFEEMLEGRPDTVVATARAVRALVRDLDPDVVEVAWLRQGTLGFGVGPRKFTEHYAYLALHPQHVNVGFNQGAELPDPDQLLGGPGKSLRHVRLTGAADVEQPALRALLVVAREHRRATTHSSGG